MRHQENVSLTSHLVDLDEVLVIGSRLVLSDNIFEVIFHYIMKYQVSGHCELLTDFWIACTSLVSRCHLCPFLVS